MPKIGSVKALFDFDIVAGLIVALIMDYIIQYIATNVLTVLNTRLAYQIYYADVAVMIVDAIIAVMTRGRIRKIFIYALWYKIGFEVWQSLTFGEFKVTVGGTPII